MLLEPGTLFTFMYPMRTLTVKPHGSDEYHGWSMQTFRCEQPCLVMGTSICPRFKVNMIWFRRFGIDGGYDDWDAYDGPLKTHAAVIT